MRYLVTGGAGFVGSHLVDELIKRRHQVLVYDNLSSGKKLFIKHHLKNSNFKLLQADLLDTKSLNKALKRIDFVFHLAAHASIKEGYSDHSIDHIQNLEATRNVLEGIYLNGIKYLAFASTSAVYGDVKVPPTPEGHPLKPISLYGATKAASESYIHAYAHYYNLKAYIFRNAPYIGERYTKGIIYDLTRKLLKNYDILEILTDGTPKRSAMYIKDGIQAFMAIIKKNRQKNQVEIYNISSDNILTINQIVDTIIETLNIKVTKKYLGGKKGWKGDKNYLLDSTKLKSLGWKPKTSFKKGIELTIDYLLKHQELLKA